MKLSTLQIFTVTLGVVSLAACSQSAQDRMMENQIKQETGGNASVDMQNGMMHVETSEGSFTTGTTTVPADWPSDVLVYAGAQITSTASVNPTDGKTGHALTFTTSDSAQAVATQYKTSLKDSGWKITATVQNGGSTIIGAEKDGRNLSLMIGASEGTTSVTLGVEDATK